MKNNSDYTKPRTSIFEELPDVYQSAINNSIFETTYNRQLSKTEVEHVYGAVGPVNTTTRLNLQLPEETVHRQAFQLQPLIYAKAATVDHVTSYVDVLNKLALLGVDADRLKIWGDTEHFNFAPPITIDKFINYRNYVWYDPMNNNSTAQYVTIQSECSIADARYKHKLRELQVFGIEQPIIRSSVQNSDNYFAVADDYSVIFTEGQIFDVTDSLYNNGTYTVVSSTFSNGLTFITVNEPIANDLYADGTVSFFSILQELQNEKSLLCTGGLGWDVGGWDEFEEDYTWDNNGPYVRPANPWISTNHWVHKSNMIPGTFTTNNAAQYPIIEYSSTIEMNEWLYVKHNWKTRANTAEAWVVSEVEPTVSEINSPTFFDRWVLVSKEETVAVNHQVVNTNTKLVTTNAATIPTDLRTLVPVTYNNPPVAVQFDIVNVTPPPTNDDDNLLQLIAGAGDARVFLDGIQQYGNYEEIADVNGEYIVAIKFFKEIPSSATVEIELNAAASVDVGREDCYVRHIEDQNEWESYLNSNTLKRISLTRFHSLEQTKMRNEIKYPLFDVFDIHGDTKYTATPIFKYAESSDSEVVKELQQRAVKAGPNSYMFEQTLITEDEGVMFAYHDTAVINQDNPEGLQTIWRVANERYVPKFVDRDRREDGEEYTDSNGDVQTAQVDETNGFWEIPNQLYYNAAHENRQFLSYTDMFDHFRSNLKEQQMPDGFVGTSAQAVVLLPNADYDYGIGGTIKEHNDSYDSFISTLVVDNSTPISIIEFAKTQYERSLNIIKEDFKSLLYDFMMSTSYESMLDLDAFISEYIITKYELNDSVGIVFGDSNTYNYTTDKGVKNWPATLPFIRMKTASVPVKLIDPDHNIFQIRHHDGHLSTNVLTYNSVQNLYKAILSTVISTGSPVRLRGWNEKGGITADGGTYAISDTRTGIDWQRLLPNDYWLDTTGSFYRLECAIMSPLTPTNSASIPEGTYWLRTTDGILHIRDNTLLGWVIVNGIPGDLTPCWREINFTDMFLNLILELETRLYEAAITLTEDDVVFPKELYVLPGDESTYELYTEELFRDYTKRARILDPYSTDYNATDPFTWNYSDIIAGNVYQPYAVPVADFWAPRWHTINQQTFNTPYPHLEPWKLQNFVDKPDWWDGLYKDNTLVRRWLPVMWTNILAGIVPSPHTAPAGIHGYDFVSVNITNGTTTDGKYGPDDLLPPYWLPLSVSDPIDQAVKDMVFIRVPVSSMTNVDLSKGYDFGDEGPIEWRWRQTTDRLYGEMITAFRMQPIRYTHYTLGELYVIVADLQVGDALETVYRHTQAKFHGDLDENDKLISYPGTLQWYVNYNRANSYDSEMSDFRPLWTSWVTGLSYQFGGMIDTRSLDMKSALYNVLDEDRTIIVKRSPNILNEWVDALTVTVGQFGRIRTRGGFKIPQANGADWKFIIDTPAITTRSVEYYTARNYIFFVADAETGLLETDQDLPWVAGDKVYLLTTVQLPSPLSMTDAYYFVPGPTVNTFYLADTKQSATANVPLVFTYENQYETGEHRITQLNSTFNTTGNSSGTVWRHHKINSDVQIASFPFTITGAQQVIDFIDGYSRRLQDKGFVFNSSDFAEIDAETGRVINWQFETEKLMDIIYTGLGVNNSPGDYQGKTYQFVSDVMTDYLVIPELPVPYTDGQEVFLFSTGTLPLPLLLNTSYYIIRVPEESNKFKLARTKDEAMQGIAVDIRGSGTGAQSVGSFQSSDAVSTARHQVNPFRHNLWFKTENGVVSNMVDGPYSDIKSDQTVFDQYGRPFGVTQVQVLREDKITRIVLQNNIPNDLMSSRVGGGSETLTMGGMHIFVDGYEHVVRLNNYTANGDMIYDPYVGLNVPRLLVDYYGQEGKNQRPVIGGYVINDQGEMTRNIEGSIEDIQTYYDTFAVNDNNQFVDEARSTFGYVSPDYLNDLGVTDKTKFLFWKGLLQSKGSVNAVKAFVNSAHFVDAQVDEFWAYKIAEFGDNREQSFPEIKMSVNDARVSDVKYQFTSAPSTVTTGFDQIVATDDSRWVDYPTVAASLEEYGLDTISFGSKVLSVNSYRYGGQSGDPIERYDAATDSWVAVGSYEDPYIILDVPADSVEVLITSGVVGSPIGIHEQLSSRLLEIFPGQDVTFDVYTKGPNFNSFDPSSVIDRSSNTTVATVSSWDPARGKHYNVPYNVVDFESPANPVHAENNKSGWAQKYIGYTWLDTSLLDYKPYYDRVIYPTTNEQLYDWGRLAEWSSLKVLEWVKSPVLPSEYVAAASNAKYANLPNSEKISGFPVQVLFKSNGGSPNTFDLADEYEELHVEWHVAKPQPTLTWPSDAIFTMYVNGASPTTSTSAGPYGYGINTYYMSWYTDNFNSDLNEVYYNISGKYLLPTDVVRIVRRITTVETGAGEYKYDYDYIEIEEIADNGVTPETFYYFWVESRAITSDRKKMSAVEAQKQLRNPAVPYHVVRKSSDTPFLVDEYDQLIVRDMAPIVTFDNRYSLQLTRNYTLRDEVRDESSTSPAMLKNVHSEWNTFRRNSTFHPPLDLWTKATETVVGFDLLALANNQLLPVPSLDRVLYDNKYGTTTRLGLTPELAIVDPIVALNTVLSVINSPTFDCSPVNKFVYLNSNDFTTPQGRKEAMDEIYNTFPSSAVNDILFEILLDGLTLKSDYPDLFKTSWVAIHGIRLLETAGNVSGF